MTDSDQAAGLRPKRRLLSSIRDVLFESETDTPDATETAIRVSSLPASASEPASSDVDAARTVLRTAIEAQLGPGIREFSLQNEALVEVLPDSTVRRNAALRVLALKGTTREHLCAELTGALGTLAAQGDGFARKLRERRDLLTQSAQSESQRCSDESSEAEKAIAHLQSEIDALRASIREAEARRDQQLAESEAALVELGLRERAFQRAFHEVEHEYLALQSQLSRESL
ncbi:MAG TPA: hypothetical protein VHM25_07405 [Polyangiaceae bacterium]|jgi:chromosome segregation ATPase|nr:hypothetical protein [Polyangiaceae bacterium]